MRVAKLWIAMSSILMSLSMGYGRQQQQQTNQQQPPQQQTTQQPQQQEQKKPIFVTPAARLESARTVLVRKTHGSDLPYEVIGNTLEGWGRFTMVDSPEKADIIVEISSEGGDSGVRVSSSTGPSAETGRVEQSNKSSRSYSPTEVTMTVLDAKYKRTLWTGTERVKAAFKETARENNTVEAAQKLASRFHDRLEPPPKP